MNELSLQVLAGLIVVAVSGAIGFLIKRRFAGASSVLPVIRVREHANYDYLSGEWFLYYVSRHPYATSTPVWISAKETLTVRGRTIKGTTVISDHPSSSLRYRVVGEIRLGRMILVDHCISNETEFASVILPDLLKTDLVGIWAGFDGQGHLIAAPVVLSRVERNQVELTRLVVGSPMTLIPPEANTLAYSGGTISPTGTTGS